MCGIAGIVTPKQTPSLEVLQRMTDKIAHRGPDDSGYFVDQGVALGHRRLSIIDLSKHGHQPMANEDESVWLTFNGEIYNYIELAEKLSAKGHQLKSHSDSETIIHSYEDDGFDCVNKFNGMFAFAIWDSKKQLLFAARDRLGIKPFYYYYDGHTFLFGSEIKAITAHPAVTVAPERETILQYMLYSTSYGDKTWYKGIKRLEPGCYLTLQDGKLCVTRYWDIKFQPDYHRSYDSFVTELRTLTEDAVSLHLRSDVPVGSHLSGGIDSSSIVALASRHVNRLHTFSGAFAEGAAFDEREYIKIIAERFNTNHHEIIPTGAALPELLTKLLWHLDEPVAGPGAYPQLFVCQLVKDCGVKVVMGGQGGDELFGGYPPYYALAIKNILKHLKTPDTFPPLSEICRLPLYGHRYGILQKLFKRGGNKSPSLFVFNQEDLDAISLTRSAALEHISDLDPYEFQAYQHIRYYLPTLLHVEDRTSMAYSIESRVPLLDYRLVELAAKMPSWMKVRNGTLKYILRDAMRGKVPDQILDRRDKKGFPTPISQWFAGDISGWVRKTLVQEELMSAEFVDPAAVAIAVEDHIAGRADNGHLLWSVLNLELWMRGITTGWRDAL